MWSRRFGGFATPWREMERMRREMNRLFATAPARFAWEAAPCYPAMNVWTSEGGAIVTAELPGFDPNKIDISVTGDTLTLSGKRERRELTEGETYHRRERACGTFSRALQLPFPVEPGEVEASFENGVLSVSLPRAESDKPKKISIKSG